MLLPVYHKAYDAAVLLLPLAWALRNIDGAQRHLAWVALVALSVFMIPFDLLALAMDRTDKLNAIAQTMIWKTIIYPHHALGTSCCH